MKKIYYKWFEVTIRYYNPAFPVGMATETIAVEAENFSEAENRVRQLYNGFRVCEILSICPALYDQVLFSEDYYEVMHWFLVELEEDADEINDYNLSLRKSGCNCSYLGCCARNNTSCNTTSAYGVIRNGDDPDRLVNPPCDMSGFNDYAIHGNIRNIDFLNAPSCFRYAGYTAHKEFLLIEGRDFTHALKRVKEYMNSSIIDNHIFAIAQTRLCEVIPHDICQL